MTAQQLDLAIPAAPAAKRFPLSRGRNRVPDDAQLQIWKRGIRRRTSNRYG